MSELASESAHPRRRVVVVTGAAGGIGSALAARFVADGDDVALLDRDGDALRQMTHATARSSSDGTARAYVVDLAAPARCASTFERIHRDLGVPDLLVNAAAVRVFTPLLELDVERWQAHQDVNLRGALLCLQHTARLMIEAGRPGCIVNITSIAGHRAVPDNTAYGVTKAGLTALTRYAAAELGRHGIRVVAVAPGPVRTPLTAEAFDTGLRETLLSRMAVKDIAEPSDVVEAVAWVSSTHARFVNGTTLYVDGGFTIS